jgi:hypothetical protein
MGLSGNVNATQIDQELTILDVASLELSPSYGLAIGAATIFCPSLGMPYIRTT